ncbi:MAG: tRNA (adenosine(37)-N6)-threonylcarbamoyltransferase complex dimerization subunit type 1 TsaB [Firmicutes bacterium]|nr:tRNA (adenosine(37)-N6)-threonylcarbamoyltransferase complex dimerization subunit type 1 TsaB [Bacillota bacterium]
MKILYIDTTSSWLYSAVFDNGKITGEKKIQLGKDLSVFTLSKIKELLEEVNLEPNDIDKILVVNGPGSFTGIRIGVTIAKTYAWGLKKQISTISSLEAMALSSKKVTSYKVPVIDARRSFCYAAIYDENNLPILKEQYMSYNSLNCVLENLPGNYTVITNDNIEIGPKEEYIPDFERIISFYENRENINPHSVNPIYLKLTEAEEKNKVDIL